MDRPGYLNPFILDVPPVTPEALTDHADLYLPDGPGPAPVVVLVPGLSPEPPEVGPREWPVFRGYAAELARRGVAAIVLDHDLSHGPDYPRALESVLLILDAAVARPDIDGDRCAFWIFSAGGPLALALLVRHGERFGPLALTYPLLESAPGWPSLEEAVATLGDHDLVLTTVGQEIPELVPGQQALLAATRAAGVDVDHIAVDEAAHGFESQEPTADGRDALTRALTWMAGRLLGD